MTDKTKVKKWRFNAIDFDATSYYIDTDGKEVDEAEVVEFVGTLAQAENESDRRADLFTDNQRIDIERVIMESRGAA